MDDRVHPTAIDTTKIDDPLNIGREIMRMRYDIAMEVLFGIWVEAEQQAMNDMARGRPKLAKLLVEFCNKIDDAGYTLGEIVKLCKPYIDKEIENES